MVPVSGGRILCWMGLLGMISGTILLNTIHSDSARSVYLGLPIAVFVLGIAVLEKGKAPDSIVRILTSPGLVWLGSTSYVLYLSHGIFLHAWSRLSTSYSCPGSRHYSRCNGSRGIRHGPVGKPILSSGSDPDWLEGASITRRSSINTRSLYRLTSGAISTQDLGFIASGETLIGPIWETRSYN